MLSTPFLSFFCWLKRIDKAINADMAKLDHRHAAYALTQRGWRGLPNYARFAVDLMRFRTGCGILFILRTFRLQWH